MRRPRHTPTVLSLAATAVLLALWAQSYARPAAAERSVADTRWRVASERGWVWLGNDPQRRADEADWGATRQSLDYDARHARERLEVVLERSRWAPLATRNGPTYARDDLAGTYAEVQRAERALAAHLATPRSRPRVWYGVPYAALVAASGVTAAAVLARAVPARRRWRRRERGQCLACGYDLRATPGRCPECGTMPAAPAAP